ncbi:unnamed protein product, partial [Sphenostylis stenocarpa]
LHPSSKRRSSSLYYEAGQDLGSTMLKHGYHPGQGLGADSQGMREPPKFEDNPFKYGLGYDPTKGRAEGRKREVSPPHTQADIPKRRDASVKSYPSH